MKFNWKESLKILFAALLGLIGAESVDFTQTPTAMEYAKAPPGLEELEPGDRQPIVDDGEEAKEKYLYEAYLLCDCSEGKTIGGNGMPTYEFTDAAYKTRKVFLALSFPLAPGLEAQLTKLKACGEYPVVDIIDYSPVLRKPKE